MDPQKAWDEYMGLSGDTKLLDQRFARLNVEVAQDLPRLDQVDQMSDLEKQAKDFCDKHSQKIKSLSVRLIASLFYLRLEKMDPTETDQEKLHCKGLAVTFICLLCYSKLMANNHFIGTILCRLPPNSPPLKKLCERFCSLHSVFWIEIGTTGLNPLPCLGATRFVGDDGAFTFPTQFFVPSSQVQSVRICMSTWNSCRLPYALISGFPYSIAEMKTVLLEENPSAATAAGETETIQTAEIPPETQPQTPHIPNFVLLPDLPFPPAIQPIPEAMYVKFTQNISELFRKR